MSTNAYTWHRSNYKSRKKNEFFPLCLCWFVSRKIHKIPFPTQRSVEKQSRAHRNASMHVVSTLHCRHSSKNKRQLSNKNRLTILSDGRHIDFRVCIEIGFILAAWYRLQQCLENLKQNRGRHSDWKWAERENRRRTWSEALCLRVQCVGQHSSTIVSHAHANQFFVYKNICRTKCAVIWVLSRLFFLRFMWKTTVDQAPNTVEKQQKKRDQEKAQHEKS